MTVIDSKFRPAASTEVANPVVVVRRRTIDTVLVCAGALAVVVLAVAGGLLTWGNSFAGDYVGKELSSQHITFPTAPELTAEGRVDLMPFAGHELDTGAEAQAYAGYINGHLAKIAGGATYADLGAQERLAKAAVTAATTAGQAPAEIAVLQGKADAVSNTRNTLFKGETLRGLLLSAYAWSTVGKIAGIAAVAAFIGAALMTVLVALGVRHHRKTATRSLPRLAA